MNTYYRHKIGFSIKFKTTFHFFILFITKMTPGITVKRYGNEGRIKKPPGGGFINQERLAFDGQRHPLPAAYTERCYPFAGIAFFHFVDQ